MSGGGHGGGGASWKPLIEIGGVIVAIWVLWYFTGGPQRAAQQGDMPFMNAPEPIQNGNVYDLNGNAIPQGQQDWKQ